MTEVGFFELAEVVWAEADAHRADLKAALGDDLGGWLADMGQYGAAWTGDVWEWTAIGVEDHIAFMTLPPAHPWDHGSQVPSWGGLRKPHRPDSDVLVVVTLGVTEDGLFQQATMPESYL